MTPSHLSWSLNCSYVSVSGLKPGFRSVWYGNFGIIVDFLIAVSQRRTKSHAPHGVLYLVTVLVAC